MSARKPIGAGSAYRQSLRDRLDARRAVKREVRADQYEWALGREFLMAQEVGAPRPEHRAEAAPSARGQAPC